MKLHVFIFLFTDKILLDDTDKLYKICKRESKREVSQKDIIQYLLCGVHNETTLLLRFSFIFVFQINLRNNLYRLMLN